MRLTRLLTQRGAALVEAVFGTTLLVTLCIAIVQMALLIYARNVVAAATHEGARAAVELNSDADRARELVSDVVERSISGLVDDVRVSHSVVGEHVVIAVSAKARVLGPLPISVGMTERATAVLPRDP